MDHLPITPERFWDAFSESLRRHLATEDWPTAYLNNTPWTNVMVDRFLPKLGEELGFQPNVRPYARGISTEWCNIDVGYFDIHDPIAGIDENWDWEVAIEHENGHRLEWMSEFAKLMHIVCGLKVIITYHDYRLRTTIEKKIGIARQFHRQRRYRQNNEQWLLIFGPTSPNIKSKDFVAYHFDGNFVAELAAIPIISTLVGNASGQNQMTRIGTPLSLE